MPSKARPSTNPAFAIAPPTGSISVRPKTAASSTPATSTASGSRTFSSNRPVLTGKPFSIASSPTVHHGTLELASNLQPMDYESAALMIELRAQSNRVSALIRLCRPTIGRPRG